MNLHPEKKRKKIAVLQFSRLGDILMSLPAIEALHRADGDAEIYFLINAMFEGLLPESPCFKPVPIGFNSLYEALKQADSLDQAMVILDEYLSPVLDTHFDLVVNLSSQKISAILTSILSAAIRRGLIYSSDETLINPDPHLCLFTEMKAGRRINWLHQVDIYSSVIDGFKPRPLHETGEYLFSGNLRGFIGERFIEHEYVLVSPGASIPQKEIDERTLHAIIQALLEHTSYDVVLCGTSDDATNLETGDLSDYERVKDWTGKTDLRGLYSLIYHSECLISNDSGPMHAAALLDRKNIVFSTGSAFFPETTGYNSNIMIFIPHGPCYPCPWIGFSCAEGLVCKETWDRNGIVRQILHYIWGTEPDPPLPRGKIYKTAINGKGLFFIPCGRNHLSITELTGLVYQSFWREKLFVGLSAPHMIEDAVQGYCWDSPSLGRGLKRFEADVCQLHAFLDQLILLFQAFTKSPKRRVFDKIREGIDIIFNLSDQETFLAPLLQCYKVLYHSAIADNLHDLLAEYHGRTVALKRDLERIGRLISFVLSGVVSVCTCSTESNNHS
jgi:ADP-heptose:LPS heptosyltransferase